MSNHMIIGLGGTGGKIIRSFRKAIYQEFRSEDPRDVHITYLYVDSSDELMGLNDPTWKVLGHSIQLGRNSQLKIGGADLSSMLDNIGDYPGIQPWIGDRSQWKDILGSIVGETLGGQKRRLGRFLFANQIDAFNSRVQNLVNELSHRSGEAAVTFHILSGLAGGTGSGCLIDVIAQLRDMGFADQSLYRIIVYTLLPDSNPPQNWDTGNYHANGYAALAELNAMSVGAYKPHDLTGVKDRISLKDPFNGCYVFTKQNENGMTVDVDKVMPDIVADFLYQKIVAVQNVEEWPGLLRKMENAENGDGTPETAPGSKYPERSKRFLTFGIKRLAVPEEEILEYMTYSFTYQSSLQLLYNNWQDGLGFQEEPKPVNFKMMVQQDETRSKWRIRDDQICLSQGVLEADVNNKRWKPIQNEWQDFINSAKSMVRENVETAQWPTRLEEMCRKRFEEDYRTLGVKLFYETMLKARADMAKEITRLVEADLFEEWRSGGKSMHEVSRLLNDLIADVEDRAKGVNDRKTLYAQREETAFNQLNANMRKWTGIGFFGRIVRRHQEVFDAHGGYLQEMYIYRTWQEGWEFARKLLDELKESLNDLKAEVDDAFGKVRQVGNNFKAQVDTRCNDDRESDLKKHLIRYYSPETVRTVTGRFVRDQSIQNAQTGGVRSVLIQKMGEHPGFKAFNKNISVIGLTDTLETECEKSVKRTHDLVIQSAREKLLGVSIIERLENQYGGSIQDLRTYITDLVNYAGSYVTFSSQEKGKRGEGIPVSPNCVTEFTSILPRAADHSDFMGRLKKSITESRTDRVHLVETESRPNEITFISITNLFPLRFLSNLSLLKEKYEQRIHALGKERATLEIHVEGDGSQLPSLMVDTEDITIGKGIPWLLLAKASGLLSERENRSTGMKVLSIVTKDENGFDNEPIDLGATLSHSPEHLTPARVNLIREEVQKLFDSKEILHVERQQAMIEMMNADIEAIKSERGMDDEIYKGFLAGAKEAAKLVKAGR